MARRFSRSRSRRRRRSFKKRRGSVRGLKIGYRM